MTIYPSAIALQSMLFTYLSNHDDLEAIADVTEAHPNNQTDLNDDRSRIVIQYISDPSLGEQLSRSYISPVVQFTIWAIDIYETQSLAEKLVEVLETHTTELNNGTQKTLTPVLENSTGIDFSLQSDLYFLSLTYSFPITFISGV